MFWETDTTLDGLNVHCECTVESRQLILEAVNIKISETREYSPRYIVNKNIIDLLKPQSVALLQTKCQELWEEEQGGF